METNLQKYLAFVKTAEFGSFTKAAESLNYTQSAVSRMVNDLEAEWNQSLFIRGKSGTRLTASGQQLLPLVRKLCKEYEILQTNIDELNGLQSGIIRIGAFSSVATHWLPQMISFFQNDYPGIEYELLMGSYAEIENWVLEGTADCGFLPLPIHPRLNAIPVEEDELFVVLPVNHPMADCITFPLNEIEKYPFILPKTGDISDVSVIFDRYNLHPDIRCSTFDDYAIMSMVEHGLGISILPELILRRTPYRIIKKRLQVPAYRYLHLVTRKDTDISPVTKRFITYLKYRNSFDSASEQNISKKQK